MNAKELALKLRMLSVDEVEAIHKVVKSIRVDNPVAVNIGAGVGTSTIAMLEASPNIYVFEVDKKLRGVAIKHLAAAGFATQNRVSRVIGNSWDVGANWPYQVDLVFVDGAHHDEAVMADIDTWLPKVKPFGYMLFHDYHHPNVPGLTRIVDQRMEGQMKVCEARFLIGFQIVV